MKKLTKTYVSAILTVVMFSTTFSQYVLADDNSSSHMSDKQMIFLDKISKLEREIKEDEAKVESLKELISTAKLERNGEAMVWGISLGTSIPAGITAAVFGIAWARFHDLGYAKFTFIISAVIMASAIIKCVDSSYSIEMTDEQLNDLKKNLTVVQNEISSRRGKIHLLQRRLIGSGEKKSI